MSYTRVIPRDLFNEANLLKCYGQLWLKLDVLNPKDVMLEHTGRQFDIEQNINDGSLTIENIKLTVHGREIELFRPLNSREPWPLYASDEGIVEYEVFTEHGELHPTFLQFLTRWP